MAEILLVPDEVEHLMYKRLSQLRRPILPAPAADATPDPAQCPIARAGGTVDVKEEPPAKFAQTVVLAVSALRAERLAAISEGDALASGWKSTAIQSSKDRFAEWWNKRAAQWFGGARFESNPWVWVMTVERSRR
jgi:hypothetical protein